MFEKFSLKAEDFRKTQKKLSTITLILTLTIATLMAALPLTRAEIRPNAFLSVSPNPVGVNQPVTVMVWCEPVSPDPSEVLIGFIVTITKPDGNKETLGPVNAWPMGAALFTYTPNSLGTYVFKFNYPGQTFASTGDVYAAAESPTTNLTVQQERIPAYPGVPLPSEYWTQPVNSENREWSAVSGGWLMCYYNSTYTGFGDATAGYNPYSKAPRSPHIMWTKPATLGGLAGGDLGSLSYYSGISYRVYLTPPIIMSGRLYYNLEPSLWGHFRYERYPGFVCVDLRTGKELWRNEQGGVDVGQQYINWAPVGAGVRGFLWDVTGSTWDVFDPFDGKLLFSFENATAGTDWWWEDPVVFGEDGSVLIYILDGYANSLTLWNSTKAFQGAGMIYVGSEGLPRFTVKPGTFDWKKGIQWSVTIPDRNVGWHTPYSIFGISDGVAFAKSGDGGNIVDFDIGYDLATGAELWVHDKAKSVQSFFSVTGEEVVASFDLTQRRWTAYNIRTGAKLWDSDQNQYPWGTYVGYGPIIVYGKLFSGSFDGYLHAFDLKNGKELWKFYSGNSGTETVTGSYPMWDGLIVADGVVFVGTGEETPTQPLTRGNRVFAVDAESGEEIWSISGIMSLRAIAEGYLLGYNAYDSQIYCFGKGPSATTVTAPDVGVTLGNSIMIKGTVSDISAGTMGDQASRFPNGVPAVSDESMSAWMEYVYMQKAEPANATGIEVKIDVIDSNGNYRNIGSATSDTSGSYSLKWTPDIPGRYTVIATFAGSDSYYGSHAETAFSVDEVAATPEPTQPPASLADMYFVPAVIGIIIAIAVVGVVLALLLLRKR